MMIKVCKKRAVFLQVENKKVKLPKNIQKRYLLLLSSDYQKKICSSLPFIFHQN